MERISKEAIRRWAERSTAASAKLEGRELPPGYVRSEAVTRLLRELRKRRMADYNKDNWDGISEPPPGTILSVYTEMLEDEDVLYRDIQVFSSTSPWGWVDGPNNTWEEALHHIRFMMERYDTVVRVVRWGKGD